MIIDKDENISIITQEKATIIELVKKIETLHPKFKNDNIIVNLSSLREITTEEIIEFLRISNAHRATGHSFVLVTNNINFNEVPEEIVVVPTIQEAYDIIEMEDIERDLEI